MNNSIEGIVTTSANINGDVFVSCTIEGDLSSGLRYINMGYDKETIDNKLDTKQDKLSNSQIANLNVDLSTYAKLSDIPASVTVPTKVSAFTNDAGYLTQHQDISNKVDKQAGYRLVSANDIQQITTNKTNINILNGDGEGSVVKAVADAIAQIVNNAPASFDTLKEISDWISSHTQSVATMNSAIAENTADIQSLGNDKQDVISDLDTIRSGARLGYTALQTHQDISGKADTSSLSTVATSGSYNDLINKPTIPSTVTDEHINELIDAKLGVIENGTY